MPILTIIRIAHASVLIDVDGHALLTDPWFSERSGYYHNEPYGIALKDLPPLDGVVVSHDHYDHDDMESFAAYPDKQVPFAVKRGTAKKTRQAGFSSVSELDPWESTTLGAFTVTATPAKHSVPENTYIFQASGFAVYFGADTVMIPQLREIPQRFPTIDVALLPINGLMIRPLLNHKIVMNPEDAAELAAILHPRMVVPIHYRYTAGFLRDHVLLKYHQAPSALPQEFLQAMATRAPEAPVRVLDPGERLVITR
ncbi:MAG TPA: MBL fold metallo-hydrolase [Ktedonobacterales bacterium]|nr:MBL fold metallo-hydrolase [Ktedonobacterales bacterium]